MNKDILHSYKSRCFLPHQIATVDYILSVNQQCILLFHKPGTGKTKLGCLMALIASARYRITIVAPNKSLLTMWRSSLYATLTEVGPIQHAVHNITYSTTNKFINEMRLHISGKKHLELNKTIVFIDEAHEMFNVQRTEVLIQLLREGTRIILATGTPIVNTPKTILQLLQLLTGKSYERIIDFGPSVASIKIKKEDMQQIILDLEGKVSYFANDQAIPKVIVRGNTVQDGIEFIDCPMSEQQLKIYYKSRSNVTNEMFEQVLSNVSLFAIDGVTTAETIKDLNETFKNNDLSFNGEILVGPSITRLDTSSKLKYFYEHLGEYPGKLFVYFSNPIYASLVIKSINSYRRIPSYDEKINSASAYTCVHNLRDHCKTIMKYMLITSKVTNDPTTMIELWNDPSNDDGSQIKILFASDLLSVGHTLKEVTSVHFLTEAANRNEKDQIIARAARMYAKKNIDDPVYVYYYVATIPDGKSYDLKKLINLESKFINTKDADNCLISATVPATTSPEIMYPFYVYDSFCSDFHKTHQLNWNAFNNSMVFTKMKIPRDYMDWLKCQTFMVDQYIYSNNTITRLYLPYNKFIMVKPLSFAAKSQQLSTFNIIDNGRSILVNFQDKQMKNITNYSLSDIIELYNYVAKLTKNPPYDPQTKLYKFELINKILEMVQNTPYLIKE